VGTRFSEKIMLKQKAKAKGRFNLKPFRFSARLLGSDVSTAAGVSP
jgi:hypothetical protein